MSIQGKKRAEKSKKAADKIKPRYINILGLYKSLNAWLACITVHPWQYPIEMSLKSFFFFSDVHSMAKIKGNVSRQRMKIM